MGTDTETTSAVLHAANETVETDVDVVTHWGCQFVRADGDVYLTRWDPSYGTGIPQPYTEAEARADVRTKDSDWKHGTKRLVTRTETTITTTVTTHWTPVTEETPA